MKKIIILITLLLSTNVFAGKLTGISNSELIPLVQVMGKTVKACENKMTELIEQFSQVERKAIPQKICQEHILKKKDKWATGVIMVLN